MKKPFYKTLWFWLAIGSILLFIANIICAIIFRGTCGANIFTAISGWVSGIATIVLGLIAVWQNRKYKEANDKFSAEQKNILKDQKDLLKEQGEILGAFSNGQQDLAWRNLIYQLYNSFLSTLLQQKNQLLDCTFEKIYNDFICLPCSKESLTKIVYEKNILQQNINGLIEFLQNSKYFFNSKEKLYDISKLYQSSVENFIAYLKKENNYRLVYDLITSDNKSYSGHEKLMLSKFNDLKNEAQNELKDFSYALSEHINAIYDFIYEIYYNATSNLKRVVDENNNKYNIWHDKIEKQEQNNG